MRDWTAERVAEAAGARLLRAPRRGADGAGTPGPSCATVDSRAIEPDALFVGIPGANVDGGRFAPAAIAAGAWGALVSEAAATAAVAEGSGEGALLAAPDPARALAALARAWRRELGVATIGVTGSTGKTSTKDLLAALLRPHRRVVASPQNLNTEIGVPLAILSAPRGTEALVLELAMRGPGQIAELAAIAEPDVGVIVNVGPVHLELLGSLDAIAAAKAELIRDLRAGATAVLPADEPLLRAHHPAHVDVVTFGADGDVRLVAAEGELLEIDASGERIELRVPFTQRHHRTNALAAVAAARAIGVTPGGLVDVAFSALRGERIELPTGVVIVNDCYNANPMSMRAALEDLAGTARGRRVAILGDMLELGPDEADFHRRLGQQATEAGVELLIAVGPLAAHAARAFDGEAHPVPDAEAAAGLAATLLRAGDTVLVKGSRGVGLEVVAERLTTDGAEAGR